MMKKIFNTLRTARMAMMLTLALMAVQTAQADPTDKTALATAIGQAEQIADTIKTAFPIEASVLTSVIDGCKDVQNNENATQADIDFATATLNQSQEQCARVALSRALTVLVAQGEALRDSCQQKHPDAINDLVGALSNSTYLLSLPDAQPLLLQMAVIAMQEAMNRTRIAVVRKDLDDTIAQVEAYLDSIRPTYPDYAAGVTAIVNGLIKITRDDPNATLPELIDVQNGAHTALTQSKAGVARFKLRETMQEAEDYYNSIKEGNPCTASVLQHIIDAAKAVNDNLDTNQPELELTKSVLDLVMQQTKAAVETGINDVRAAARVADAYYDLSGRLLNGKPSNKGIFINNGQKIIMK